LLITFEFCEGLSAWETVPRFEQLPDRSISAALVNYYQADAWLGGVEDFRLWRRACALLHEEFKWLRMFWQSKDDERSDQQAAGGS
jgi:hypothetical protein